MTYHSVNAKLPAGITRRHFMAATATTCLSMSPMAQALSRTPVAKSDWKMRLSTSSLHYRSLSLAEACTRIGKLGFQGIDVWAHFEWAGPLCEHLEEGLKTLGPKEFATLLQGQQLELFAASCYTVPVSQFAPLLGKLGGAVMIRGSRGIQGTVDLKAQMKQFIESLKPDLEMLEQHGCVMAIENHSGNSLLNTVDSVKIFTELNTHKNLGIALAPYHIQKNGESVEQAIRLASDQLRFFYAWQFGEGTQQLPGIGPTDFRPWIKALADVSYRGFVNPFMHHEPEPDDMDKSLAISRDYLEKIYTGLI
jgi:sugar phosphate isomerase/epimerase